LQFCTKLFSVFLLPQEKRTKSDSNSRFPLSILFIFRLAAALPHLPHAAMTSMAWNRCISSYRIIPVSSFVLSFHAPTRTKLKFMAGDYVSIWWRVITINQIASQAAGLEPGILVVGRESVFYNCTISGRAHALQAFKQRSNHSIRKVHAQNYDIFSEPLLDYLNLSCCRQISASLYGPSKPENWPKIELLIPAQ